MNRLIHPLIGFLFLLPQVSNTVVWLNYELNKESITQEFCVNKDKPELKCNGKCHLAEQLEESKPVESDAPAEASYIPQIPLFYQEVEQIELTAELTETQSFHFFHFYSYTPFLKIDHPPKA